MEDQGKPFQYKPRREMPAEYRRVDWTYVAVRENGQSFAEGEEAFRELKQELQPVFADDPVAYLLLLRGIEDRLLSLAIHTKQPIAKCLECLQRRLDLECDRVGAFAATANAVVLAKHAAESGEIELAKSLLAGEKEDLEQIADVCRSWLDTIDQHGRELFGDALDAPR